MKRSFKVLFFTALTSLVLLSCEQEVVNVVGGNNPPEDPTVSFQQRDRYIERVYITLLGRKPDTAEHSAARTIIDENPRDSAQRFTWLSSIMSNRSVAVKRWDDIRSELLESVDTTEISNLIFSLQILMQGAPPEQQFIYQAEIDRLQRIQYVPDSLFAGVYSTRDAHRYAVDNAIYDDINMGAENFVVSVFDHFLYRYPTQFELESSKRMVEGFRDVLFLQGGEGKQDFLEIFYNSDGYVEGQIRYVYLNYLFREPTSYEVTTERARFSADYDFEEMQMRILSTDEYFFL
ncbi:hypothetical protein [Phaeocystidibacter luteus]|uniref:Uncharacterized protein n=1 Tax=Phaeocystidibacter luteus TaxID=911197 RepID=A0A6N6RGL7_9FLAO|nr:hypothetical protein [Phaeocystidibacter luteus]KAB2808046.1 hypothetical protein F8C67_10770 [Phaeocystidibacter luteus]